LNLTPRDLIPRTFSLDEEQRLWSFVAISLFLLVFTPPVPVEFQPTYSSIVDLLTAEKMIDILSVLLWRIKHANPKSWTDRIFHKVQPFEPTLFILGSSIEMH
jgi:hypothetical protein